MLVRLKLRFWIGSELLRFDKPASKGAFRPLVFNVLLVQHVYFVPCSVKHPQRIHSIHSVLLQSTSPLLYAKPEEMLSAQKPRKRDQFMNRFPLCSRSKPLYTAPANHQQPLYGFMSTGNISCAEPTLCSRCLQWKGLSVALFRKLSMYVHTVLQSGFSNSRTDVSLNSCWTQQVLRPVRSSWCW